MTTPTTPRHRPARPAGIRLAFLAALGLALGSPAAAGRRREIPQLRRGGGWQDEFILGHLKPTTVKYMVGKRLITWREVLPFNRVRENLQNLASHADWRTRRDAIEDLMYFPSEAVEEALIQALRDPVPAVRDRATRALAEVGTNRSLRPLMRAMRDTPGPVRDTIALTLKTLTGEEYGRHYDRWRRWYTANRDALR